MSVEGVYRIDTNDRVSLILEQPAIQRPNGIAVTQDCQKLYVIDSCPVPEGNRKIWGFDLESDGSVSNQQLIWDFAPGRGGDGMRLDAEGNLWVAAGVNTPRHANEATHVPAGIYVISADGEMLGRIPVTEDVVTNLAFGGPDGRTIYITAGKSLFTARVGIPGQVAFPKWK